ncbi:unnamed protein product [Mytilus coruscus]|uniref:C2H2-type domain-containing protein n=1 Tax=Mytilus coruscus TaxID=42192 RepID=A0A6J8DE81_MYTCO|nr:unnamed protein product [Mytilus coruscus]
MSKKQKEDYIRKIWTDPSHPASFAGPDKLYKIIHKEGKFDIGRGSVKRILAKIDTYSVQRLTSFIGRQNVEMILKNTVVETYTSEDTEAMNCIGFACPEPGCQREFVSANGLERHILKGSHQYVKPAGTDVVKQMWVDKCNNIGSEYKSVIDQSVISGSEDDSVVEGWALKKTRKIVRFSPKIKIFLKTFMMRVKEQGNAPTMTIFVTG